jgi:hypothetical protein
MQEKEAVETERAAKAQKQREHKQEAKAKQGAQRQDRGKAGQGEGDDDDFNPAKKDLASKTPATAEKPRSKTIYGKGDPILLCPARMMPLALFLCCMHSVRCPQLLFISTPTVACAHALTAPKRGRGEFAADAQDGGVRDNIGSASKRVRGGDGSRAAEGADTSEVERGALEPRFSQAMEAETDGRSTTKRSRVSLSGKSVLFVGFDSPEVPMCEPMCGRLPGRLPLRGYPHIGLSGWYCVYVCVCVCVCVF